MPVEANITKADELFSGTDKLLEFSVVDADGAAQNITGWAMSWTLFTRPTPPAGATALLTKTTGAGGISITDGSGGVCQVSIADTDTDDLIGDALYYHELRRTDSGNEDVLSYGTLWLRQSPVK